jgi:hypothetical protein
VDMATQIPFPVTIYKRPEENCNLQNSSRKVIEAPRNPCASGLACPARISIKESHP